MRGLCFGLLLFFSGFGVFAQQTHYAVAVDRETQSKPGWAKVTAALVQKHQAELIVYDSAVETALPALQKLFPRYVCFVTVPEKAGSDFIIRTNRLVRQFDEDPYADALHAVLTGYTPEAALRTVLADEPKAVATALLSCGVGPDRFKEAVFLSDGERGRTGHKFPDGHIETHVDTQGRNLSKIFANAVETLSPDVIMTSAHGSQYNIEMPFSMGSIVAKDGKVWRKLGNESLIDYSTGQAKQKHFEEKGLVLINAPRKPNVFFAFGNCLTGDIPRPDCISLAAMNHLRSTQFIGYCFTTWYGEQGHLALRYWEQGGGYTALNEAHFFANQILLWKLGKINPETQTFPYDYKRILKSMNIGEMVDSIVPFIQKVPQAQQQQLIGLMWDRDCVAFYGDPAHEAYLDSRYTFKPDQVVSLSSQDSVYTLTLKANRDIEVMPWTSPKGLRFPHRLRNIKLVSGEAFEPLITDDFILVNKPGPVKAGETLEIIFTADKI